MANAVEASHWNVIQKVKFSVSSEYEPKFCQILYESELMERLKILAHLIYEISSFGYVCYEKPSLSMRQEQSGTITTRYKIKEVLVAETEINVKMRVN